MKLVLVRHGESDWNKLNLFTGWTDVDLSQTGHREAIQAGTILKNEGYELVTPVIITNTMEYLEIVPKEIKSVNAGEDIITIL